MTATGRDLFTRIGDYLVYQHEVFGSMQPQEIAIPVQQKVRADEGLPAKLSLATISTLEELEQVCEASPELHTDLPGANLVFGVGNTTSPLMLVGEAPGETEDRLREPFVGEAGQLLNKMLAAINIQRERIYIANVGKRRPKANRTPTKEECSAWYPFLKRQIELINPSVILALGGVAAKTLLHSDAAVGSFRGKFHRWENTGVEILVTYHPSALLRDASYKRPAWEDLQLLRKRLDERGITL
jgi:DNA polymerase